jgi:hypothetical protein
LARRWGGAFSAIAAEEITDLGAADGNSVLFGKVKKMTAEAAGRLPGGVYRARRLVIAFIRRGFRRTRRGIPGA